MTLARNSGRFDVLDGLKQAGLVVEQQEYSVGRIKQSSRRPQTAAHLKVWSGAGSCERERSDREKNFRRSPQRQQKPVMPSSSSLTWTFLSPA